MSKPPKITFRTSKLQTPIKHVGNIFDRLTAKKTQKIDHSLQNCILA